MSERCGCSYGGPMGMERRSHGCPIHDTDRYRRLSYYAAYRMRHAEDALHRAIENGGNVQEAIADMRVTLDKLEALAASPVPRDEGTDE